MQIADTALLRCPRSGAPLAWEGTNLELCLSDGWLTSTADGRSWPVVDGFPHLYDEAELHETDKRMRHIHARMPRIHRPLLRSLLPVLQGGGTEAGLFQATVALLQLADLRAPAGRPARVLEVGVGAGLHLPVIRDGLPAAQEVELWGVDLSDTLLYRCREQWGSNPFAEAMKLVLADAHRLPFADGTFDRVLHVGGLGRYGDPAAVLAELDRVLAPGGRAVVVGKRLDPAEDQAPPLQAGFRLLTLHEPDVDAATLPRPAGAVDVVDRQLSRFFSGFAWSHPAA